MRYLVQIIILIGVFSMVSIPQHENYPIPKKTKELLFYIQRNHNANTIIYDANYTENGSLNESQPIIVYWRRYAEQGQKMELRTIEKWYAYGVEWEKVQNKRKYKIKLVANKERDFWLVQLAPFKAEIITKINGQMAVLDHIYIYADNSGIWPTVEYIEMFGKYQNTETKCYEKIIID